MTANLEEALAAVRLSGVPLGGRSSHRSPSGADRTLRTCYLAALIAV